MSDGPAYMGNVIRYSDQLYGAWGQLGESVRTGRPALPAESYLGDDPARTRAFVMAMHDRALGIARALVGLLDLHGRRSMLDVGGGPGTYSVLIAQSHPDIRCTVLDLPEVVKVAAELILAQGCAERVSTLACDYRTLAFPPGNDVVNFFGMFHQESPESIVALLKKAYKSLNPGGRRPGWAAAPAAATSVA